MAKKTWINMAGTWKEVKNVWVNVGGVWKQKVVPKGNISGSWKEFISYGFKIYDLGIEYVSMVLGTGFSPNTVTKNSDNIRLHAEGDFALARQGKVSVVTNTLVDLTSYSKLKVDWGGESFSAGGTSYLIVSPNKTGIETDFTARISDSPIARIVSELDVSSLSGNYYIRVHCVTANSSSIRNTNVYKLWLE